jgi:hypothetical protein
VPEGECIKYDEMLIASIRQLFEYYSIIIPVRDENGLEKRWEKIINMQKQMFTQIWNFL